MVQKIIYEKVVECEMFGMQIEELIIFLFMGGVLMVFLLLEFLLCI